MLRQTLTAIVTTLSKAILPGNLRRKSLLFSTPPPNASQFSADGNQIAGVSCATTGVKLSYTVPAGTGYALTAAFFWSVAVGGQTLALRLTRGGVTTFLAFYVTSGQFSGNIPLLAGDTIDWNCTTAVGGSTADLTIAVQTTLAGNRVTLSFGGLAVLDNGINLYPGTAPFKVDADDYGGSLAEDVYAICASGTVTLGVTEVFDK